LRKTVSFFESRPTIQRTGVRLERIFGYNEVSKFDTFLLLDQFGSNDPKDYTLDFPWHPTEELK
jgi:redox-sensitive bicupin YhaK (pirin superfamily)